jgi:hypothetical protein
MVYFLKCAGMAELRPKQSTHFHGSFSARRNLADWNRSVKIPDDQTPPSFLDPKLVRITFQAEANI